MGEGLDTTLVLACGFYVVLRDNVELRVFDTLTDYTVLGDYVALRDYVVLVDCTEFYVFESLSYCYSRRNTNWFLKCDDMKL